MSITVCIHSNTDSWFDVTSVNFNSKKVHEDKIFEQQDILQFLSQGSKYYKYICKIPNHDIGTLKCFVSLVTLSFTHSSDDHMNDCETH